MTIDELKARKRELMARKKYELELQERGEGDNFALFMVNEELLDVNAQLRAIVPAGKGVHFGRKGRASSSLDAYAQNSGDRQQFIKWARADVDDAAEEARAELRKMLHGGMKSVTGRQREILLLYADGLTETAIGAKLGVHKSTVCRTLKRAKKNVASVVETQQKVEALRDGNRLDMTDPGVVKLLMGALTTHQATCFYLYYAEWLTIRQIGGLLNVDHSTICRTIKRAVARLNDVLGGVVDILDNIEGMDDVLFVIYCGLSEKDDELPPAVRDILPRKSLGAHPGQSNKERGQSVVPEFQIRGNPGTRRGSVELDQHGYVAMENAIHSTWKSQSAAFPRPANSVSHSPKRAASYPHSHKSKLSSVNPLFKAFSDIKVWILFCPSLVRNENKLIETELNSNILLILS